MDERRCALAAGVWRLAVSAVCGGVGALVQCLRPWNIAALVLALAVLGCDGGEGERASDLSTSELDAVSVVTPHDALYGGIALDEQQILLVGRFGEILRTTDGGRRWSRIRTATEQPLFAIGFFDDGHGIAVGQDGVGVQTRDGGESWARLDLDVAEPLFGLQVVGTQAAYAVGSFGTIVRTDNRGESWQLSQVDWDRVLPNMSEELIAYEPTLYAIATTREGRVWAAGEYGVIIATDDGGTTWRTMREGRYDQPPLFALAFADDVRGVAVGQQGTILRTLDGGASWLPCETAVTRDLYDVGIVSRGAVAVGAADTVIASDSTLCDWRPVSRSQVTAMTEESTVFPWLGALIAAGDSAELLVVGEGGIIRRIAADALAGEMSHARSRGRTPHS